MGVLEPISMDSLKNHMAILGHDSMEGRATGTPGEDKAASYLVKQLTKYNIQPAGDQAGSYFQYIPMHGSTPLPDSRLRFYTSEERSFDFELGYDYLLYKSGAQTYVPTPVELIFVGYGIHAPEYDYNDYQNVDVRGKIVVFLEGEPVSEDSTYFAGEKSSIYSLPESKQRIALSRGALGSCLIPEIQEDTTRHWEKLKRDFAFEDVTLAYAASGHLSVLLHPKAASHLFHQADHSLEEVFALARQHKILSFPLHLSLSFTGEFIERDFSAKNVIGLIRGSGDEQEKGYLLISAHYDHLGIGPAVLEDSIYNGVSDNASGVAAALEIGRILAKHRSQLKRSVILLFTTGEEKGLLGARFYVDHPIFPLYKTMANINIDGLAMFDTFRDVVAIGSKLSSLHELVITALNESPYTYSSTPEIIEKSESFSRSDQIAFAHGGIPSMLIMEGFHWDNYTPDQATEKFQNWMNYLYHSPFDDIHQPLNYFAALNHSQIILWIAYQLSTQQEVPEWKSAVKYRIIRLQTIAEKR